LRLLALSSTVLGSDACARQLQTTAAASGLPLFKFFTLRIIRALGSFYSQQEALAMVTFGK